MSPSPQKTILLAETRGFCAGVERALLLVEKALREGPFPVYVLHEIVHNEAVVESLQNRGVIFVDHISEASAANGTLIFSAHGVSKPVEEEAASTPLHVVDATCPIVKRLHKNMEEFAAAGRHILLFGKKGHREVEGLLGRVREPVTVLESLEEMEDFLLHCRKDLSYGCLSQTTLNASEVAKMSERLKAVLTDLAISANVCFATRDRQEAVRLLAEKCSVILVVGSPKSSNTRRLQETALQCGVASYLISHPDQIKAEYILPHSCIGITSGASAPESLLQQVCEKVRELS